MPVTTSEGTSRDAGEVKREAAQVGGLARPEHLARALRLTGLEDEELPGSVFAAGPRADPELAAAVGNRDQRPSGVGDEVRWNDGVVEDDVRQTASRTTTWGVAAPAGQRQHLVVNHAAGGDVAHLELSAVREVGGLVEAYSRHSAAGR